VNEHRPINLDLTTMKYPPMAIASILHRISGVILFILFPVILYYLQLSLQSVDSFNHLQTMFHCICNKLVLWAFASAFIYHVIAGIRHVLMDFEVGDKLSSGRFGAIAVMVIAAILIIILGLWIWLPM
jgi:succinate dehydrogenase / fumarate reductase cytochrome b subunit